MVQCARIYIHEFTHTQRLHNAISREVIDKSVIYDYILKAKLYIRTASIVKDCGIRLGARLEFSSAGRSDIKEKY